jgi:hypothetical protein
MFYKTGRINSHMQTIPEMSIVKKLVNHGIYDLNMWFASIDELLNKNC